MARDNLTRNIEIIGEWFLPNSDEKIPGVFKYEDDQSSLELLRFFNFRESPTSLITIKTIHGETKRGKVTLTDVRFRYPFTAFGSVYLAIFGDHLDDSHAIQNIGFNFDLLNEWAVSKYPYSAISITGDIRNMQNTHEIFHCVVNGITCELHISLGTGVSHLEGTKTYPLSSFTMKSENNKSIRDFIDQIIGIQQFLMLVMGRNLNLTSMTIGNDSISHNVYLPVLKNENKGSDMDHFFNISYIRENYTELVTGWFDFYLKNKYLLNLFFDTMENNEIEDTDFYVYASMLEGYYKSRYEGETDYQKRIAIVLKPFESEFSNINEFVKEVSQMRHDIFHFNRREELDVNKLHSLTHDLFFLIRMILLNGIGLNISMTTNPHMKKLIFLKRNETTLSN